MKKLLLITSAFLCCVSLNAQIVDNLIAKYMFDDGYKWEVMNGYNPVTTSISYENDRFSNSNMAASFDGVSSKVVMNYQDSALSLNNYNQFSISVWFKPANTNPGTRAIVAKWAYNFISDEYLLAQDGTNLLVAVGVVTNSGVTINANLVANNWYHVVFIYDKTDNNRHKIYLNGNEIYNQTFSGTYTTISSSNFTALSIGVQHGNIGSDPPNTMRYFNGLIDDVQLFSSALTPAQINLLYNDNPKYYQNNGYVIAKYSFDNGDTRDDVGNNPGAINTGATLTTDRFGNNDKAFQFDGTTGFIRVPHSHALSLNTHDAISISAWINPSNTSSGLRAIVSKWNYLPNADQYLLAQDGTNLLLAIRTINSSGTTAVANINANNWYHVVFVYDKNDNNRHKVYVNNVLVYNQTFSNTITSSTILTSLSIGAQCNDNNGQPGTPNRFFNGKIDDVIIFGKALTDAQVDSLYNLNNTTSIDNFNDINKQFIVYPNPANDQLFINNIQKEGVLQIYSIDGKLMDTIKIHNNTHVLDISNYTRGMYIAKFIENNGISYQNKWIKE